MATTYIKTEDGGLIGAKTSFIELMKSDEKDAPIVAVVSTEAVDSDGDIVHQNKSSKGAGWDFKHFNKSPVLTWGHDLGRPNISSPKTRAKRGKHPDKGAALFLNPLTFDEGDDFAMVLDGKVRRDVLNEFSVGFKIKDGEREPRKDDDGNITGLHIYGATLLEVAVCNRGANPETEVFAKHLLGIPSVTKDIEDGGDPEVMELKEEIADLNDKLAFIGNVVKQFGDLKDEERAEKLLLAQEDQQKVAADQYKASCECLDRIKKMGTAVSS